MAMIHFTLNRKPVSIDTEEDRPLLWVLRTDLELPGTKYGCGSGQCGACMVLIDGKATHSCLTPVGSIAGREIVTIEGLAQNGKLHPVQQAFVDHGALQCGYCTPGMVISVVSLLNETPRPSEADIRSALGGNLCRCGAHHRILRAVMAAAATGERKESPK